MAKLTEEVKTFIVQEFAMFRTPSEIAASVAENFDVTITRQQANDYNPKTQHKAPIAKKWNALYDATRAKFLNDTAEVAIAQKSYRLRELDDMARKARAKGNFVLAASLLEQAAKESGGSYTNRREITGKNGKPIQFTDLTDEQLDRRLEQIESEMTGGQRDGAGTAGE